MVDLDAMNPEQFKERWGNKLRDILKTDDGSAAVEAAYAEADKFESEIEGFKIAIGDQIEKLDKIIEADDCPESVAKKIEAVTQELGILV